MATWSKKLPLVLGLVLPSAAWAGGTAVVAPFVAKGVDSKITNNITGLVSSELDFSGAFDTVNELAQAPSTLNAACLASTSCLQGIGKGAAADAVVTGSVGPGASGGVQVYLVYYDVKKNAIVRKKTYDVGSEPSVLADKAGTWVKELTTGQDAEATAAADAVPTSFTESEDDELTIGGSNPSGTTAKTRMATDIRPGDLTEEEDPEDARQEAAAKAAAAAQAKASADAKAKADADAKARAAAAAQAKAAADAKAKADADARAAAEAQAAAKAAADAKARADAQARADAAARAAAAAAAAKTATASKPAASEEEFSFGSAASSIQVEEDPKAEDPVADDEDYSSPPPSHSSSSSSHSTSSSSRSTSHDDEDLDEPSSSSKPSKTAVSHTTSSDDEDDFDLDAPSQSDDDEDLDSPTPSKSHTASRDDSDDSSSKSRSSSTRDDDEDSRSSSRTSSRDLDEGSHSSSKSRYSDEDSDTHSSHSTHSKGSDEKPGIGVTARIGYSRYYDFNFVTYGGELTVPISSKVMFEAGLEGFSTQRELSDKVILQMASDENVTPAEINAHPWNTILPLNLGLQYKVTQSRIRPYVGADLTITPYSANFDVAIGARARVGADFMVADAFGLNLNLAAGIMSGKNLENTQPGTKNTGIIPQISGGTVVAF